MARAAAIIQISGQDEARCERLVRVLAKTLKEQGYALVELRDQSVTEALEISDEDLLARAIGWTSRLLSQNGIVALVVVSEPVSSALAKQSKYVPTIELGIDGVFSTSAPHQLNLTAQTTNLPQEIAQVVLLLAELGSGQEIVSDRPQTKEKVYSAEEEALLEEHLRALGYL